MVLEVVLHILNEKKNYTWHLKRDVTLSFTNFQIIQFIYFITMDK